MATRAEAALRPFLVLRGQPRLAGRAEVAARIPYRGPRVDRDPLSDLAAHPRLPPVDRGPLAALLPVVRGPLAGPLPLPLGMPWGRLQEGGASREGKAAQGELLSGLSAGKPRALSEQCIDVPRQQLASRTFECLPTLCLCIAHGCGRLSMSY